MSQFYLAKQAATILRACLGGLDRQRFGPNPQGGNPHGNILWANSQGCLDVRRGRDILAHFSSILVGKKTVSQGVKKNFPMLSRESYVAPLLSHHHRHCLPPAIRPRYPSLPQRRVIESFPVGGDRDDEVKAEREMRS